jgi:hypothetical protein
MLLALALSYGLLQLCMALLRAIGKDAPSGELHPFAGLILFQGVQGLALLGGGILAGAGQRRGIAYGAMVGVLSGLLTISAVLSGLVHGLVQSFSQEMLTPGTPVRNMAMYALPVLQAAFGALGGLIGSSVWRPLPDFGLDELRAAYPGLLQGVPRRLSLRRSLVMRAVWQWNGPISWLRVLIGTTVAVAGALYARSIIDFVVFVSEGKLKVVTQFDDSMTYGEVFSLSILIGGCIAGTNSFNGLKQGVCVGIATAVMLVGIFWSIAGDKAGAVVYPVMSTLCLGPIGGWFGSELLPPIYRQVRRRKRPGWLSPLT